MNKIRDYIEKNPQQTKRLLGMEYEQLLQLIKAAQLLDIERKQMREEKKVRLIKSGGGCRPKLSAEEQLLLTLTYLHQSQIKAEQALKHVRDKVFTWLRTVGTEGSSFERYMQNAEFKINKLATLIEVCNLIDERKISEQNQDVQGDLYKYLLVALSA